jgi:RNA polymerase sigma factor (sigma-70 family)
MSYVCGVQIHFNQSSMSTYEFQQHLVGLRQQLFYFALSLTRDRETAQDLLQESILRALTYREKFQENTNFKAWLYTIMKNTFINDHRRSKRTGALMERAENDRAQASRVETATSAESAVKLREIDTSLARLDNTFREPFRMHHEGFKYHEIADRLSIPIGTVKSRIHQARLRLIDMLSDKRVK